MFDFALTVYGSDARGNIIEEDYKFYDDEHHDRHETRDRREREEETKSVFSSKSRRRSRSAPPKRERDRSREREGNNVEVSLVQYNQNQNNDRRMVLPPPPPEPKPKEMWTEITKDLVTKEAIEYAGYAYEETPEFFYVMEYLRYVRTPPHTNRCS